MGNIKTLVLAVALISALLLFSFLILTFMQPSGVPEKGPVFRIENDAVKEDLIKRGLIEKYPNGTRVIHLKGVEELIKKGVYRINPDGVLERNIIGNYEELIGNIKLLISERFTEEKDGAHIFLNLATERIYSCCNFQINSDVKIQGDTIIVEVKNIFVPRIGETAEGPATFSKDLGKIEGDYQLILRHKTKEDKYNLKITKDKIEINPIISTFTVFNQPNILFRVPENVIWIDCGHYDRVECEENQEYIKICDQFFKEPLISNLQPFEPEEGEYAVKWFNKGHKHFKFFGNISDLRELVESYAIYTSRDTKDKERCLLLSIRTWRGDFFYTWDYTWERKTAPLRENRQLTVEKIAVWQNGEEKIIDPESSEYNEIGNLLIQTLHKLDLQAVCAFTKERVHQEIKRNDKVVEIIFKQANDFPIRQWIEPEGRYNVLKNVKSAIFILEDNLDEGLEGHILVGSEREKKDERCSWKVTKQDREKYKELGPLWSMIAGYEFDEERGCIPVGGSKYIKDVVPFKTKEECELACGRMWSCWAIEKGDGGLNKGWIDEINEIISTEEYLGIHCCEECLEAFSGCPIAVGPETLMCGKFSSGYNMSEECREYFKEHPASVTKCESLLKGQSETQNVIIGYNMGGLTKVHIENNKIDYTYSKLREGEMGGTFIGAYAQFEESAQISEEEIKSLLKIFEENDFFNLKEEYGNVSPYDRYYSHSIRLKTNQKDKTVLFKDTPWTEEAPPEFTNIEQAILQLADEKFNRKR